MDLSKTSNNNHQRRRQRVKRKYEILEIALISAYDLDPPIIDGHKLRAVLWLDPNKKIESSIRTGTLPEWPPSEKFVFIVAAEALHSFTMASAKIELYDQETLLGTSRALLGMVGNCGRKFAGNSIGAVREYHVRRGPDGKIMGGLKLGFTVLEGLPDSISDEKLFATGLAVDCGTMTSVCEISGGEEEIGKDSVVKRLLGFFCGCTNKI